MTNTAAPSSWFDDLLSKLGGAVNLPNQLNRLDLLKQGANSGLDFSMPVDRNIIDNSRMFKVGQATTNLLKNPLAGGLALGAVAPGDGNVIAEAGGGVLGQYALAPRLASLVPHPLGKALVYGLTPLVTGAAAGQLGNAVQRAVFPAKSEPPTPISETIARNTDPNNPIATRNEAMTKLDEATEKDLERMARVNGMSLESIKQALALAEKSKEGDQRRSMQALPVITQSLMAQEGQKLYGNLLDRGVANAGNILNTAVQSNSFADLARAINA